MLQQFFEWTLIFAFIIPLPATLYVRFKKGEVSAFLAKLSTFSFLLFSLLLSVIAYGISEQQNGIYGKTYMVIFPIITTIWYYKWIVKTKKTPSDN